MNKRIAVIYKSVYGATEHYARWIADALRGLERAAVSTPTASTAWIW